MTIEEQFYPETALDELTGVAVEKINSDRLYGGLDRLEYLRTGRDEC